MSAERGWIGDPQPPVEWRDSHYSRTLQKLIEEIQTERVEKNAALRTRVPTNVPPLRIAARYSAGRTSTLRRVQPGEGTDRRITRRGNFPS
jgi:hypothetical protein